MLSDSVFQTAFFYMTALLFHLCALLFSGLPYWLGASVHQPDCPIFSQQFPLCSVDCRWGNTQFPFFSACAPPLLPKGKINSEGKIVDHRTIISDTKTAASVREVPMPNILKTTLLEWKKSRWVQQRTTGKSFIGPNDLVFANNEGELRTYTGTKTIFQRLMSQNGLAPYNHKDVTTTIRTYNSVDRSYFKQAVDKLDSKFHFDDD